MKHNFIIDGEEFSVQFYEYSAHVCQIKEEQAMGFFIRIDQFENIERWYWYPSKAADYIKKMYKNRMFL